MPTYTITDPQSGKSIRITGDSPPSEAEIEQIFAAQGGSKGGGLSDFLPAAGGVAGGLVGTALGGPVGAAVGSGIGGAAGEFGRQFIQGEDIDPASVAGTGLLEGATAGAIGGVVKHGGRVIRGLSRMVPSVSPELVRQGADLAIDMMPGTKLVKAARLVRNMIRTGGGEAAEAAAPEVGRRAPNIIPPSYLAANAAHRAAVAEEVANTGSLLSPQLRRSVGDTDVSRYLTGDARRQALMQELLRSESLRNLPTLAR